MAYRTSKSRLVDVETDAIVDLRRRIERLRRQVALPMFIAVGALAPLGAFAHAFGYWSLLGRLSDGRYFVSAYTMLIAGVVASAPVLAVGIPLYVALRARLRKAWRAEVRHIEVTEPWPDREAWLAAASRRFG